MKRLSYVTSQLAAAAILWRHNFCAALRAFSSHFFLLGNKYLSHQQHHYVVNSLYRRYNNTSMTSRLTVVSDGRDDSTKWLDRTSFFLSAVLLSTFILLFLLSSSVSLSFIYLSVPMRGSLGKYSCMSSSFPIAILNGTCSLRASILFCGDVPAIKN